MEAPREFEGDSLDEALRAASDALDIPVERLHYEMVEEGRKGVFGLGARAVRIRVDSEPDPDLPLDEPPAGPAAPVAVTAEPVEASRPEPAEPPAPEPVEAQAPPRRRSRRAERPRPRSRPRPAEDAPPEPVAPEVEEARRDIQETVERMVGLIGLELNVRAQGSGSGVRVQLGGADRRLLLQKDAQLLSAFNFLLNRMSRRAWPGVSRIQVQCDGHRPRRDEDLIELVREVAGQVARTGKPKQLHPMNPYERRLAHITIRDIPGLSSRSIGDGFLKKIRVTKTD